MLLSTEQKEEIRKIRIGDFYAIDEKGEPLYESSGESKINYDVGQMRQLVLERIREMGYTVYNVKPTTANCIIRVYREEKEYDGIMYRILGAHCYTKAQNGSWYCVDRTGERFKIDFSKHVLRTWFFQDEYWDASVDFFDTYVKLVEEN